MTATDTDAVAPSLSRLDADGVEAIHDAAMTVVADIGIQVRHERAQRLVEEAGGRVDADDVATLPREVVVECVARAPSEFTLHARNPEHSVTVGGDGPPVRAPGYGADSIQSFSGERRPSTLSDYEDFTKLAQLEDVVTCVGFDVCEPTDIDREARHVRMLERSLTLTDKPVMGSTRGEAHAQACLDMAAIATEEPSLSRPVIAGLVNTLPPRGIGTEMLGALLAYAEHGQPVIVSSFTMPGASGPRSFAASLAQANAETLFGIALAQLCNPGTPVVYGLPLARVDDQHESLSIGGPASGLFASVTAQLGRYYGVPTRAGGGLTDAVTLGHQSGAESVLAQAVTALAGVDFVLHSVGVLDSYGAVSREKFVLDCETLRALKRFREGISVPEEGINVERIASVDPAGHYLGAAGSDDDTGFRPRIAERRPHRAWADGTRGSTFERAHEYVEERLAAYERPPMDDAVERRLRSYVEANLP